MSYLEFHLVFILPLIALLGLVTWWETRGGQAVAGAYRPENRWAWRAYFALPLIALVYTTPWDNYLVWRGVWEYGHDRVLGVIGYVPVEEYLFFVLQPLLVGLWTFALLRRGGPAESGRRWVRWGGALFFAALSLLGAALLFAERGLYFGLILAWAAPISAFQWAFGGDLILSSRRRFWLALMVPTVYLWAVDAFAIHGGIWHISDRYSVNIDPLGLPLEEAAFFLITNLMVVQGLLLALHPQAVPRLRRLLRALRPWVVCVAVFALLKIPVPLAPDLFPLLGTASTAALALGALLWAWERVGARALLLAAGCLAVGLGVEVLGSRSGFPFGPYAYSAPGPVLWEVPLLVPLGWWGMTVSAFALSRGRPLLTGTMLVAWDVALEPLMTGQASGIARFWEWQQPALLGAYYGVPVTNFIGWFAVGSALAWGLRRLAPELAGGDFGWAYRVESLFLPAGLLLMGLYPAALTAAAVMGALAWISSRPPSARWSAAR
ncbi:putative membrane protein [Deinobacterium chartae]|uniref:Putative membrane protein n=1 Tax=Deinobacterium chartae TaxID=521158 RepID=A0A841HZ95_9DEIO|nr:carotenoid biosynthesis protein [Deinobacterium chartae]MBB6098253.1 putative membrane protein [Deinobacterium chartae]